MFGLLHRGVGLAAVQHRGSAAHAVADSQNRRGKDVDAGQLLGQAARVGLKRLLPSSGVEEIGRLGAAQPPLGLLRPFDPLSFLKRFLLLAAESRQGVLQTGQLLGG